MCRMVLTLCLSHTARLTYWPEGCDLQWRKIVMHQGDKYFTCETEDMGQ